MDDAALKSIINANARAKAYAMVGAWNDCAAEIQSQLPMEPVPTVVNEKGIYWALGDTMADSIFGKLDALANATGKISLQKTAQWLVPANEGVDLGEPQVRAKIDFLATVQGGFTAQEAAALKGIAERKPLITNVECQKAWGKPGA